MMIDNVKIGTNLILDNARTFMVIGINKNTDSSNKNSWYTLIPTGNTLQDEKEQYQKLKQENNGHGFEKLDRGDFSFSVEERWFTERNVRILEETA